jgi:hypothetical protein
MLPVMVAGVVVTVTPSPIVAIGVTVTVKGAIIRIWVRVVPIRTNAYAYSNMDPGTGRRRSEERQHASPMLLQEHQVFSVATSYIHLD